MTLSQDTAFPTAPYPQQYNEDTQFSSHEVAPPSYDVSTMYTNPLLVAQVTLLWQMNSIIIAILIDINVFSWTHPVSI